MSTDDEDVREALRMGAEVRAGRCPRAHGPLGVDGYCAACEAWWGTYVLDGMVLAEVDLGDITSATPRRVTLLAQTGRTDGDLRGKTNAELRAMLAGDDS